MNRLNQLIKPAHDNIKRLYPNAKIEDGFTHYKGQYEFHFFVGDNVDPYALQISVFDLSWQILKDF